MYSLLEIERKYGYNKRKNILEKRGRYLKKKECAYCKKEFDSNRKRSAEHIFPQVLLELFPEQDVSFTPERTFKDNFGLTIADVCSECNNGILSGLDLKWSTVYRSIWWKIDKRTIFRRNRL